MPPDFTELTLEQFKLACISEELTDSNVDILANRATIHSEDDVIEFVAILAQYRPALKEKFFARVRRL